MNHSQSNSAIPNIPNIPDVQGSFDIRQIPIQRVGVKALRYPITVCTVSGAPQGAVGLFNLDVALPAEQKGTHMSRFVELLEEQKSPLEPAILRGMVADMLTRLNAIAGRIEVTFNYFVEKTAPVSGVKSLMDYEISFFAEYKNQSMRSWLKVLVPVTSLCPCSKKISEYGAHNQRSHITITAELETDISIEKIIRMAEEEASCELWGILKRPDEKFVTEQAYRNPKFVEDLVRDIAQRLNQESAIIAYILEAENFESIHNHSAYALIENDKRTLSI